MLPVGGPRVVRIALADDHQLFREALRKLLESEPDFEVIGEADDGEGAVALARRLAPDVMLLDVAMPSMSGLEALRELSTGPRQTRVILLTAGIDKPEIVHALQLGARGLVMKQSNSATLLRAIRGVMDGDYWVGRESISDLMRALEAAPRAGTAGAHAAQFSLTPREREVIVAVVAALGNREIAEKLNISEKTVKRHLTSVFDKLGVSTRLELALFAVHHGLDLPTT